MANIKLENEITDFFLILGRLSYKLASCTFTYIVIEKMLTENLIHLAGKYIDLIAAKFHLENGKSKRKALWETNTKVQLREWKLQSGGTIDNYVLQSDTTLAFTIRNKSKLNPVSILRLFYTPVRKTIF